MTGSRTPKCSFSSHVWTRSDEQDFDADFPIIFRILLMVAVVKKIIEALVSFSTCLDVISGDLWEFKSRFLRIFSNFVHKVLNLSARSISESQSGSSVFFFRWRSSSSTLNSSCWSFPHDMILSEYKSTFACMVNQVSLGDPYVIPVRLQRLSHCRLFVFSYLIASLCHGTGSFTVTVFFSGEGRVCQDCFLAWCYIELIFELNNMVGNNQIMIEGCEVNGLQFSKKSSFLHDKSITAFTDWWSVRSEPTALVRPVMSSLNRKYCNYGE